MIVGITGGSGCGKTTLLSVIAGLGGTVVDCDKLYHRMLTEDREMAQEIARRFPGTVTGGKVDRRKLGELVFSRPDLLDALNGITHPRVKQQVSLLLTPPPALAAVDAIGLFESGLNRLCRITVAVTAPRQERIARLIARDGITAEAAEKRIAAQPEDGYYRRLCDFVLENNGNEEDFRKQCLNFCLKTGIINNTEKE